MLSWRSWYMWRNLKTLDAIVGGLFTLWCRIWARLRLVSSASGYGRRPGARRYPHRHWSVSVLVSRRSRSCFSSFLAIASLSTLCISAEYLQSAWRKAFFYSQPSITSWYWKYPAGNPVAGGVGVLSRQLTKHSSTSVHCTAVHQMTISPIAARRSSTHLILPRTSAPPGPLVRPIVWTRSRCGWCSILCPDFSLDLDRNRWFLLLNLNWQEHCELQGHGVQSSGKLSRPSPWHSP